MKAGTKGSSRIEPVVFHTFNTIFMLFVVTVTLYPFLQTLAVSFNDGSDTLTGESISGPVYGRWRITGRSLYQEQSIMPHLSRYPVRLSQRCLVYS